MNVRNFFALRRFNFILVAISMSLLLFAVSCGEDETPAPEISAEATEVTLDETPTPEISAATVDLDTLIERVSERASEIRGLDSPPADELTYRAVNQEGLNAIIEKELAREDSQEDFRLTEPIYKMLGLIPKDDTLLDIYNLALSEGVAGLYDPETKEFVVLQKTDDELDSTYETTFVHEYLHLLQDYSFDLLSLQENAEEYSDSLRALQFLVEGDATYFEITYGEEGFLLGEPTRSPEDGESAADLIKRIPLVVLQEITAPYTTGTQFVLAIVSMAGYEELDNAFRNPPETSEQIIHFEKYLSDERFIDVELDSTILGEEWLVQDDDRQGEFFIFLWLTSLCGLECSQRNNIAIFSGGEGWNGDNSLLMQNDSGEWALLGLFAWDDPERDSIEFYGAIESVMNASDVFTSIDSNANSNEGLWRGHSGVLGARRFEHPEYGWVVGYVVTPSEELTRTALETMAQG